MKRTSLSYFLVCVIAMTVLPSDDSNGQVARGRGQEPVRYGSIGVVAYSRYEGDLDTARTLATEIIGELRRDRRVEVRGDPSSVVAADPNLQFFAAAARKLDVSDIAGVAFQRDSQEEQGAGVATVRLVRLIDGRPTSLLSYVDRATKSLDNIRWRARKAASLLLQRLSNGGVVATYLDIRTVPGLATYRVGTADPATTDKEGLAQWVGTLPAGKNDFIVTKPSWMEHRQAFVVGRPQDRFFYLSLEAQLMPAPPR